ncbi:MAG: hypothetical protein LBG15_08525 [Dysgonamonadaceae bacterium]|jgi:hypothetical protein|nr:hypothetical protein [Dysgonamonadaceae bacterium]
MIKFFSFKVTANKNIGGKREVERYEEGILTKIVAGKGKKDDRVKLFRNADGRFVRMVDGKVQNKEFEVSEVFSDVSWIDVTPKERKYKQNISGKIVSVINIKFLNNKVIEKGESVKISSTCSPSAAEIEKAFREQGKKSKSSLSTDFFTIERI